MSIGTGDLATCGERRGVCLRGPGSRQGKERAEKDGEHERAAPRLAVGPPDEYRHVRRRIRQRRRALLPTLVARLRLVRRSNARGLALVVAVGLSLCATLAALGWANSASPVASPDRGLPAGVSPLAVQARVSASDDPLLVRVPTTFSTVSATTPIPA